MKKHYHQQQQQHTVTNGVFFPSLKKIIFWLLIINHVKSNKLKQSCEVVCKPHRQKFQYQIIKLAFFFLLTLLLQRSLVKALCLEGRIVVTDRRKKDTSSLGHLLPAQQAFPCGFGAKNEERESKTAAKIENPVSWSFFAPKTSGNARYTGQATYYIISSLTSK